MGPYDTMDAFRQPRDLQVHGDTIKAADKKTDLKRFRVDGVVYARNEQEAQQSVDQADIYMEAGVVYEDGPYFITHDITGYELNAFGYTPDEARQEWAEAYMRLSRQLEQQGHGALECESPARALEYHEPRVYKIGPPTWADERI